MADWNAALSAVQHLEVAEAVPKLVELANARIGLLETIKLDRVAMRFGESLRPFIRRTAPIKLALSRFVHTEAPGAFYPNGRVAAWVPGRSV